MRVFHTSLMFVLLKSWFHMLLCCLCRFLVRDNKSVHALVLWTFLVNIIHPSLPWPHRTFTVFFHVNCSSWAAPRARDQSTLCSGLLPLGPTVAPIQSHSTLLCFDSVERQAEKVSQTAHKPIVNTFFVRLMWEEKVTMFCAARILNIPEIKK